MSLACSIATDRRRAMTKVDFVRAARIVVRLRVNAEIAENARERRDRNAKALLVAGAFITFFSEGRGEFDVLRFRSFIETETVKELEKRTKKTDNPFLNETETLKELEKQTEKTDNPFLNRNAKRIGKTNRNA